MRIVLDIDPATLSTAQQKGMFHGRVFTNPKVAKSMRAVRNAMLPVARGIREQLDMTCGDYSTLGIELTAIFYFAFPKSGTKKEKALRREGQPVTSARYGDLDNRHKAFQDAIAKSGAIPDDHFVSHLDIRKCYTLAKPRIAVWFDVDLGAVLYN